jgi:hypothetical protein
MRQVKRRAPVHHAEDYAASTGTLCSGSRGERQGAASGGVTAGMAASSGVTADRVASGGMAASVGVTAGMAASGGVTAGRAASGGVTAGFHKVLSLLQV